MKRVLTALALIPPVVYVVLWAPAWLLFAVVAFVSCLSFYEFSAIASAAMPRSTALLGYAAGLAFLAVNSDAGVYLTLLTLAGMTLAMRAGDLADSLPRAACLLLGVLYIFGCWKCALLVHRANPHWLMFALLVNWCGDIGAYYVGRNFGRHKLAPRVSPKKTWEGAAGSLLAALLLAGAYLYRFIPGLHPAFIVGITLAANAAGQVGDLAESALKRGVGVKDSGTMLPGHGGFLDRVDSTLFALPVVYACLRLL